MRKSLFFVIFALFIITLLSSSIAFAQILSSPKSLSPGKDIRITLVNQEPDPVSPGNLVKLRFKVENYGTQEIKNVVVKIKPGYGYQIAGDDSKAIGTLIGGQRLVDAVIITFNVKILPTTPEGPLEVILSQTSDSQDYTMDFKFNINVQTTSDALGVTSIFTEPEELSPGKEAQLVFRISNSADSMLQDVKVSLNLENIGFSVLGSTNEKTIRFINPKSEVSLAFTIMPNPDTPFGIYKIPVTITFKNSAGTLFTQNIIAGIIVNAKPSYLVTIDSTDIYTPKTKGKVTIAIANTGNGQMKFTELELLPGDYDIISTSKLYIGNIDSDDTQSSDFTIYVKKKVDKLPLNILLKFKDTFNNEYSEKYVLELPLRSSSEASRLGLGTKKSIIGMLISFMIFVLIIVFWVYILIDLIRNPMPKEKKILWVIVVVFGMIIGAVIYYFAARKRSKN